MRSVEGLDLRTAAEAYGDERIAVLPLILDDDHLPKKPALPGYSHLRPEDNSRHNWNDAAGLGIVLGRPSGNRAVIDVDDLGLSDYLVSRLSAGRQPPLMDHTARGRLHVYCIEPFASVPVDLEVRHQNRRCLVQLLATGCQAAVPPTPGYCWLDESAEPLYGEISACWRRIALEHHLF